MKKLFITLVAAAAAILPAAAQGNSTRTVRVDNFSAISTSTGVDVIFTQGPLSDAVISAPESAINKVSVSVKNNTLIATIISKGGRGVQLRNGERITVTISAPNVSSFSAASGGDIRISKGISVDSPVSLKAASGGDIYAGGITGSSATISAASGGDINIGRLSVRNSISASAASGGDVNIQQVEGETISLSAASGGDVNVKGISASNLNVSAASGGDASVKGIKTTSLNATAASAGDVKLAGSASVANLRYGSSSSISYSGLKCRSISVSKPKY